MIISSATAGSDWFLNGVSNLQAQELQTERQLSSGYKVQDAADAPSQALALVELGSSLGAVQTWQANLGRVQAETSTADQALGNGISLIETARTLALQGSGTLSTAAQRQNLAAQVSQIQQQIVSLANTQVEGRFIFGGDQPQSAPYQLDAASPTGADNLTGQSAATRVIVNPQGDAVYTAKTAQQIFDPRDAAGAPAAGNTLAALQALSTALQANDQPGITNALSALESSSSWLNQQQAWYGAAGQRLTGEVNDAANQVTSLQTRISAIRDTDVTKAATDLTRETTSQTAAYGAEAQIPKKSLFDYLG